MVLLKNLQVTFHYRWGHGSEMPAANCAFAPSVPKRYQNLRVH
ncbi:hypothetical protein AOX55_00002369 [Sinorhizobium fredii CCBAU 25509]|nr:hypothetical protein AOX55_00002369 [Sinorhizobium fredii CCBAU 25509]